MLVQELVEDWCWKSAMDHYRFPRSTSVTDYGRECRFSLMPEFVLKRLVLSNFPTREVEAEIANSIDFMVSQVRLSLLV